MSPVPGKTRILLAGGGTGGHILTGLSILDVLRQEHPLEAMFVGTRRGLEVKLLTERDVQVAFLDIEGILGKGWMGWIRFLRLAPRCLYQSYRLLRSFRPDLVIGLGGYSSGPILWTAARMKNTTLILEPNVLPGMTNRRLKSLVDGIAVAFPETAEYLGTRCRVTGIPVRREFFACRQAQRPDNEFRLLLFGGSQGSQRMNALWIEALPSVVTQWNERWGKLEVVHQTGEKDYPRIQESYRRLGFAADIRAFITDMPAEFARAHMVLSRAGAGTIGEWCAAGRTGILIPFPFSAEQHQKENARVMERHGAALMLLEEETDARRLAGEVVGLAADPLRRQKMESMARAMSSGNAAEKIAGFARELLERKTA